MVSMSLFYHMILSKKPATFWDHALERLPTRWTHLIDKESLRFKELEHVLIEKVEQVFRDMLQRIAFSWAKP